MSWLELVPKGDSIISQFDDEGVGRFTASGVAGFEEVSLAFSKALDEELDNKDLFLYINHGLKEALNELDYPVDKPTGLTFISTSQVSHQPGDDYLDQHSEAIGYVASAADRETGLIEVVVVVDVSRIEGYEESVTGLKELNAYFLTQLIIALRADNKFNVRNGPVDQPLIQEAEELADKVLFEKVKSPLFVFDKKERLDAQYNQKGDN